MNNLALSATAFFGCILMHIVIVRILNRYSIRTFKTVIVFPLGLATLLVAVGINGEYAITSCVLYVLFSLIYSLLYTGPYLNDVSPTFRILSLVAKNRRVTIQTILAQFNDSELLYSRLDFLEKNGLLLKKDGDFVISSAGKKSIRMFQIYRRMLKWGKGG
jgi:hypothetical protein